MIVVKKMPCFARTILSVFLFVALFLCVSCVPPPLISFYVKPGVNPSCCTKIAVMRFASADIGIGQEISDTIALQMMQKGYDVMERSQLQAVIDETAFVSSGFTDNKQKDILMMKGINVLMVGSVSRYSCQQSTMIIPTLHGPIGAPISICTVSLSAKILDVRNGDILWAVQASHSNRGRTTAAAVLNEMLPEIVAKIP